MPGTLRGRKWNPPSKPKPVYDDDIEISLDLGEDVEVALSSASTEEIVDLAGEVKITQFDLIEFKKKFQKISFL